MSRTKKIPFADSLAIWAETCSEEEFRDGVVSLGVYARQRRLKFVVRVEAAPVHKFAPGTYQITSVSSSANGGEFEAAEKPLPLLEGK